MDLLSRRALSSCWNRCSHASMANFFIRSKEQKLLDVLPEELPTKQHTPRAISSVQRHRLNCKGKRGEKIMSIC